MGVFPEKKVDSIKSTNAAKKDPARLHHRSNTFKN